MVMRGDFIVFFNKIFDALCKLSAKSDPNVQSATRLLDKLVKNIMADIEEFISLLKEHMNVLNPYVRQFLVGWITVLDSVPDIDILGFLPDFLDGLFNMLSDSSHEIRQQADLALSEFLLEMKNSLITVAWQKYLYKEHLPLMNSPVELQSHINEFVKLGGDQLTSPFNTTHGDIVMEENTHGDDVNQSNEKDADALEAGNELVGVVSDENLLELLELAMSSNTTETVKRARELMELGVYPMVLMSQMATLIMDIIAGTYQVIEASADSLFDGRSLTEAGIERLKHALKLLSESEKQLRLSSERSTWFTATLLQLGSVPSADLTPSRSSRTGPNAKKQNGEANGSPVSAVTSPNFVNGFVPRRWQKQIA
ncbi:hypothetical protein Lser_V15G36482 [Lactuca serriola]